MLTQIYEISGPEEAREVSRIGVDHVGVLVGDGRFPREVPVEAAAEIAAAIVPPAKFSALFLAAEVPLIAAWAERLRPWIVHLGAAPDLLSALDVAALKETLTESRVMRSVPVTGEESLAMTLSYEGFADFLLLDSYRTLDRQIGGLGVTHDWKISRRIVERVATPVILAGGLRPSNVAEAIRAVRPTGVDSKTKTDREGSHVKDLERVRRFHEAVRAAGVSVPQQAA